MSNTILADKGDEQKIIAEEKEEWLYQVLMGLGVAEELIVDLNNEDLISYLTTLEIEIFDKYDDTIDIFRKDKIVAQWKKPKLTLVREGKNKYYYEIKLNEWALPFQMKGK